MAFDSQDPSTWGVDFGRQLSPEEVAYYAPTMQQNYDRNVGQAATHEAAGLDGSQWTQIYDPGQAVYGATSATPQGNQGSYNTAQNVGSISAGPSDSIGGALNQVAANGVQPMVRSATNVVASPLNTLAVNSFGSGAATGGRSADQVANIRAAWADYLAGKRDASSMRNDMTQYGVNYQDIADVNGMSVADVVARLSQPAATANTGMSSGVGYGQGVQPLQGPQQNYGSAQHITQYPTYENAQLPTHLPAPTPYTYQSNQGPVASYFPPSYWANSSQAYGGMSAPKFAEGGAVEYNPALVDQIYNNLKGL